jgi:redox-sensing transcriptional repressor
MMRMKKISDAVVRRLPLYMRVLDEYSKTVDTPLISSQELGDRAGVSPSLVRKDLAWFGEFGKQGVGYDVEFLRNRLQVILNLDREVAVALVGVGSLGLALTRYVHRRYNDEDHFNLHVVALFDNDPNKIGANVDGIVIDSLDKIPERVRRHDIRMGLITVPAPSAQAVADLLVAAGIKAILNFAPIKVTVPEDVHVTSTDLSLEMQRLAYYSSQ